MIMILKVNNIINRVLSKYYLKMELSDKSWDKIKTNMEVVDNILETIYLMVYIFDLGYFQKL